MHKYLFLGLLVVAVSCKKENKEEDTNAATAQTFTDVAYGSDNLQKMDVYLPAGRDTTNTKLLILIHGGAWLEGDKADFTANIKDIQALLPGYAIANINYRLYNSGNNKFPAQENDVNAAVKFLLGKLATYHISNKIVLLGASAGAHLALLQGYKYTSTLSPKAIISFFAPTDLAWLYNHPADASISVVLASIIGYTPTQNADIYTSSSPISFVSSQSAPTLLLQGDADPLVPVDQATRLNNKLNTAGTTHQLVVYPGEGHGFTDATMTDAYARIVSFLKTNVP
jgi:acetyl esterase/lipase